MKKFNFANLPTRIEKLERLSKETGANIYIKRDDQTGSEFSGNKIRKLEFSVKEALENGCNFLITCGGIQSNHCRTTVAIATKLGLRSAVLLRISEQPPVKGNYFLDKLMGADVRFCTRDEYSNSRMQIMEEMAAGYAAQGYKPYIIPEGASNEVGTMGYFTAMKEIALQEQELGIKFDTVVCATGSGGTYSGLYLGNELFCLGKRVLGFCVCDNNQYFTDIAKKLAPGAIRYFSDEEKALARKVFGNEGPNPEHIEFCDGYVGIGYALSRPEELEFIKKIARLEGLVLDPVYTGKAMYGVYNELKEGGILHDHVGTDKNILFIHTGGLYGLFPVSESFVW